MFPINIVEKETGFSKYLLRMWERRYSFPKPARDEKGDRIYNHDDLEKLKLVKVLMQEGYRPSKIMHQSSDQLKSLIKSFSPKPSEVRSPLTIIVLTNPHLLEDLKKLLQNQTVKNISIINEASDFAKITL